MLRVGSGAHPEADLERWRRWITELNVRFGADFESLDDTYIDRDVYNWDQAIRRLALGAFMTGERSGDPRIMHAPEDGEWLPHETPGDARDDVARLITLTRCLISDARQAIQTRLTIAEWASWLGELINRYITATEPADEVSLNRCLRAFETLAAADLEGLTVPYAIIRDLARERLHGLDAGRGQHQADGVVVSSLLPMRAIPFKVIFVLGLGEGEFPSPARIDPLDLRQARRRAGDVSSAERDRYLFLETILAARQAIVLSWIAREDRTGEPLEPASVVRELQYILRGYIDADTLAGLTRAHPVSAFDPSYFPAIRHQASQETTPLQSMSPEAERGARARALRTRLDTHVAGQLPEGAELLAELSPDTRRALGPILQLPPEPPKAAQASNTPIALPLSAIQRFLESPLQGAARHVLGLQETEALDTEVDEPLDVHRFVRFDVLREAFWAGSGDMDRMRTAYADGFERRILAGDAPVGLFATQWQRDDLRMLETWQGNLNRLGLDGTRRWPVVRIGRAKEFADVQALLPAIRLEVPRPDGGMQPVELHGPLLRLDPEYRVAVRCLSSSVVGQKHFLPGFLTMVALAALERTNPKDPHFRVVVNPTDEAAPKSMMRRYHVPPAGLARDWLTTVVADLLYEPVDYRLPIEVVLRWKADKDAGRGRAPFMPRSDRNSAQYGPVRDIHRFGLPAVSDAEAMVRRRLLPWFMAEV